MKTDYGFLTTSVSFTGEFFYLIHYLLTVFCEHFDKSSDDACLKLSHIKSDHHYNYNPS